jgi:transcriptional antiterminator RfaH
MVDPVQSELQVSLASSWYAIQTRYRAERKVAAMLQHQGVETFLPLLEEVHGWSDRQKTVAVPLFPGYVFVRVGLSPKCRMEVLRTQGVIQFVTFGGKTTPVPSTQIEHLQTLLARKFTCALHPFLKVGQRVRIRSGCLNGLEGILEQNMENNLVISIESIQRAVSIKIDGYELELI